MSLFKFVIQISSLVQVLRDILAELRKFNEMFEAAYKPMLVNPTRKPMKVYDADYGLMAEREREREERIKEGLPAERP